MRKILARAWYALLAMLFIVGIGLVESHPGVTICCFGALLFVSTLNKGGDEPDEDDVEI